MKKLIAVLLTCVFVLGVAACGEDKENGGSSTNEGVIIDVDFSKMSITLASAKYDEVIENYEDFLGKTMKLKGAYIPQYIEEAGETLQFIWLDCPSGCKKPMEFKIDGLTSPDDYPEAETIIEITGTLEFYTIPGYTALLYVKTEEIVLK